MQESRCVTPHVQVTASPRAAHPLLDSGHGHQTRFPTCIPSPQRMIKIRSPLEREFHLISSKPSSPSCLPKGCANTQRESKSHTALTAVVGLQLPGMHIKINKY